jgi:hypothetical protein
MKPPSGWELMSAADQASWLSSRLYDGPSDAPDAIAAAPAEHQVTSLALDEDLIASDERDVFMFHADFGHDTILGFEAGPGYVETIAFHISVLADVTAVFNAAKQVGCDVVIPVDNDNAITLKGVPLSNLTWDDFRFVA